MNPGQVVESLDRSLTQSGEDVTLQRLGAPSGGNQVVAASVICRALVRGYRPQEMIGNVIQGDTLAIISPTQIIAASYPGGIPRNGDKVVVQGKQRNVQAVTPIYLAGELVRIELQLRG